MRSHISPTQYGFREGYSSEQAILAVRHCIQQALNAEQTLVLIFVDLEKAFDSLPSDAIVKQLFDLRCSRNLVRSVAALLELPTPLQ